MNSKWVQTVHAIVLQYAMKETAYYFRVVNVCPFCYGRFAR